MTPLYIIPAREGSKGIPKKNIKALGGKPLLAYTVNQAMEACSRTGGYILLSTDGEEIASVGREYGLEVDYMRPPELGGDNVGSREVILDAMDWARSRGIRYDCVVLLQPTSPLRDADDILGALKIYSDEVDMVVSVCDAPSNPYYTLYERDDSGFLHICKGDGLYKRRQDLPEVLEYNGAVYVINPKSIRDMELGRFKKRLPYKMPQERSLDIDNYSDWAAAEVLLNQSKCKDE